MLFLNRSAKTLEVAFKNLYHLQCALLIDDFLLLAEMIIMK